MFFRILKKDLKRKKTMNIILLIFVVLSTMFAGASFNNIMAVTQGIDSYFDLSELPDVMVYVPYDSDAEKDFAKLDGVTDIKTEHLQIIFSSKDFIYNGKQMDNFINPILVLSDAEMPVKYFDSDNNVIKSVEKGTFYCSSVFTKDLGANVGDIFKLQNDDIHLDLEYKGNFKGALISNSDSSNPYIILNSEDFSAYAKTQEGNYSLTEKMLYISTSNTDAVLEYADKFDDFSAYTRDSQKNIYLFDMLAAYILMLISLIIMLASFIVLRFTIGFTIQEEFREIGVMKAVGINNGSIRSLYITKYLALAVIGAFIGFFASIPLSNAMLDTVSKNMVLGSSNSLILNMLSAVSIIVIIMAFCYLCTRKVKKLSPIDAVRNGQTGERFKKKSIMHLGHSKLPATGFLAVNDITSAPKQFLIITVVFTLCMLMMTLMSSFADTLKSDKLFRFFNAPESNITILDSQFFNSLFTEPNGYKKALDQTEKTLEDTDIKGKYSITFGNEYETEYKGKKTSQIMYLFTKGDLDNSVRCDEGSAPQKLDEIALTGFALDELGAEIGDTIKASIGSKEYEFIITGKFSSFMNGGKAAVVYKDFDVSEVTARTTTGIQLLLDGDPTEEDIDNAIVKIKDYINNDQVYTNGDAVKMMTQMSDTLNTIKKMMMIITIVVTVLIVVLMERSFISKEKSEIALMKAVGIQNRSIMSQHTLRFIIIALLACIISSAAILPVSKAMMTWICNMIGDISNVDIDYNPMELFGICPAILLGVTAVGTFLTSLYNKHIKAADTASIE